MTILSIGLGLGMLWFGIQKIIGLPGSLEFLGGAAHTIGLTFLPVVVWGWMAIVGELVSALLLLFGCRTAGKKIGALIALVVLLVALAGVHNRTQGATLPYIFGTVALLIIIFGGGKGILSLCGCGGSTCKTETPQEVVEA